MHPRPSIFTISLLFLPLFAFAQKPSTPKSPSKSALDSLMLESNVLTFKQASTSPDTSKASLRVRILEKGGETEPIQGATVLLRRDKDKMLGRVTKHDGRCLFSASPATYTVRVQMTGLKTLEKSGVKLEGGKVYDLEIAMSRQ